MTSKPTQPAPSRIEEPVDGGAGDRDSDVTWASFGYLGAIVLGPVIPLAVFVLRRSKSAFMRYHAARAVNVSVTAGLFAFCALILGSLLALDNLVVALVIAVPIELALWLIMLKYLVRGFVAANRGDEYDVPAWICARIAASEPKSAVATISQ